MPSGNAAENFQLAIAVSHGAMPACTLRRTHLASSSTETWMQLPSGLLSDDPSMATPTTLSMPTLTQQVEHDIRKSNQTWI